jgi:magnesium-transporting ATPase (P-type)
MNRDYLRQLDEAAKKTIQCPSCGTTVSIMSTCPMCWVAREEKNMDFPDSKERLARQQWLEWRRKACSLFFVISIYFVILYVAVAYIAYALSHPKLTYTQVFLDFWNAVTWNW